jgi:RNA-directed DNA polymerase
MLEALEQGVKGKVWYSLWDKVCRPSTLYGAWRRVKANKGSAGSDHQSIRSFERNLVRNLNSIERELCRYKYRPHKILRKYVKKLGSKEQRPLGIPTVRDRVVQTALKIVIEPIFERDFVPNSYGFRPEYGCMDAVQEVDRLLEAGYTYVVDVDLRKYFDSIPHERLMEDVRRYIGDGSVLGLIEAFLQQEILDGAATWTPEEGTPQGAVISPMLANLYMHSIDIAVAAAGFYMLRYADDSVIMCRSMEEAQRALALMAELTAAKGLVLHPEKTRVVDAMERGVGFDFLGYHFECGKKWPRKKSLQKFKDSIRSKTRRGNGNSIETIIANINRTSRGWFGYFKHSTTSTFKDLDGWIRRRLRSILRVRRKRKGISRIGENQRWPNKFFRDRGYYSLVDAHKSLLQSS